MSGDGAAQSRRPGRYPLALSVAALVTVCACRPAEPDAVAAQPGADAPVAEQAKESAIVAPNNPGTPVETHWQCGERRIAARLDPASQTLTLIHERGQLALPQSVSASGARYADANGNEFWSQDNGATLTLSGTPPRECEPVAGPGPAKPVAG
jgi:membrane-bound inhibitor of C-type lysozyme